MSEAATTVFLVRHGAHDLLGRIVAGRMEGVALNPEGRAQAARAAARLARERIGALYASPVQRARETAGPIAAALALPVGEAPGLTELDYGSWTGRDLAGLDDDPRWSDWNHRRANTRIPDGESMAEVSARGAQAIEGWRRSHPGEGVAATTHGDVIKAVVCGLIGLSFDRVHDFEVGPGSVTSLVVWQGGGKLLTLNEIPA
ncbi:histidine phosphatase family protein [Enterovirga sp.]|uniref:histidine phosphatase family protein n=1 Tax=Enterovirga sp. TaxID=2026350 RepID=UPI0026369770|nr:histidine phosphatase family protein [Enterovirga sp.]MDB5590871.1 histidine phosphatase family protein [Enterovirga sp.]